MASLANIGTLLEPIGGATPRADVHLFLRISGVNYDLASLFHPSTGGDTPASSTGLKTIIAGVPVDIATLFRRIGFVGISFFGGDTSVTEGESANFYVTAVGSGLHFEWRKNGSVISGAPDSYNYNFTTSLSDAGTYSVRVYNAYESVTSSGIALTVEEYVEPPDITGTSGAGTYTEGDTIYLGVTATGDALNYEWQKGGTPISGAPNSDSYSFTSGSGDSGSYRVRVYNTANSVLSGTIAVVVESASTAPNITSFMVSPDPQHWLESVTVSVTVSDSDGDMTTFSITHFDGTSTHTIASGSVPNASGWSDSWSYEIPLGTATGGSGGTFTATVNDAASNTSSSPYTIGIMT